MTVSARFKQVVGVLTLCATLFVGGMSWDTYHGEFATKHESRLMFLELTLKNSENALYIALAEKYNNKDLSKAEKARQNLKIKRLIGSIAQLEKDRNALLGFQQGGAK